MKRCMCIAFYTALSMFSLDQSCVVHSTPLVSPALYLVHVQTSVYTKQSKGGTQWPGVR